MKTPIAVKHSTEGRAVEPRPAREMFEEMEQLAERMLPLTWMRPLPLERLFWGTALPQVNILDREAELVVQAAAPGFGKDDIEVTTTTETVTLHGRVQREKQEGEKGGEYYRREIQCQDFLRTIHLPCLVDDTKTKATFKDGMLELILPKLEAAKRHTVKIEPA